MTNPSALSDDRRAELMVLAERCEAASGPDRELDAEMCALLAYRSLGRPTPEWVEKWPKPWGFKPSGRVYLQHTDGSEAVYWDADPLTASLDAALALLEEKLSQHEWAVSSTRKGVVAEIVDKFWSADPLTPPPNGSFGEAAIPALALCAALLRAVAAQEHSNAE